MMTCYRKEADGNVTAIDLFYVIVLVLYLKIMLCNGILFKLIIVRSCCTFYQDSAFLIVSV
jgi:hypothetical protein